MSFDLRILNGDLAIGSDGDVAIMENTDKLIQDILKIINTPVGGNPFFPGYGSPVSRSIVGSVLPDNFNNSVATSQIKDALTNLQKYQREQQKTGQRLSPSELLAAIQQVQVERNQTDPRFITITIRALSKDLQPTVFSFNMNTIAL